MWNKTRKRCLVWGSKYNKLNTNLFDIIAADSRPPEVLNCGQPRGHEVGALVTDPPCCGGRCSDSRGTRCWGDAWWSPCRATLSQLAPRPPESRWRPALAAATGRARSAPSWAGRTAPADACTSSAESTQALNRLTAKGTKTRQTRKQDNSNVQGHFSTISSLTCLSGCEGSIGGSGWSIQIRWWKGSRRGRWSRDNAPFTSPPLSRRASSHCSASLKPRECSSFICTQTHTSLKKNFTPLTYHWVTF